MARRNLAVFRKLCGEANLKSTVIITNMWTPNPTPDVAALEAERERELASKETFFKTALSHGAHMTRHDNTTHSAHEIIRSVLGSPPTLLEIQNEMITEKKTLAETSAATVMRTDWTKTMERWEKEKQEIREQLAQEREEIKVLKQQIKEEQEKHNREQRKEIERLTTLVQQLTQIAVETTTALEEAKEKIRTLSQQEKILAEKDVGGDVRLAARLSRIEVEVEQLTAAKGPTQATPNPVAAVPRHTAVPVRRVTRSGTGEPRPRRDPTPERIQPKAEEEPESWRCVVQ